MAKRMNRRDLLGKTTVVGAGLLLSTGRAKAKRVSPNEKLDIALIGIGGQGGANLNGVSRAKQNVVALCDVDDVKAGNAYERFGRARKFYDYRRMLDKMESQIDAVVVSTPDHTHAHAAMMAMRMGKHLYCEKPMAHSVSEVRQMTELAAEKKLATQLGVQRHTKSNIHRVVELIRSGAIGEVRECHAWVGGDRGMPAIPTNHHPVPEHLKWDLWLGPAKTRPYCPDAYAPYNWRFWWDFGTGETGNWGCHILDIPFWSLKLGHAVKVAGSGPPVHPQTTPKSMATRLEFPARGSLPPVTLHWYHTKSGPPILAERGLDGSGCNNLFVGSEGMLLCGFDKRKLLPESKFADFEPPPQTVPDSPGFHQEWIAACKGGKPATCNFDYSGPMTEAVLLANTAYRVGQPFDWDAKTMTPRNCPAAEPHIRPTFRKGWPL